MDKLAILQRICGILQESRPQIGRPFGVNVHGEPWSLGTDGRELLAYRGRVPEVLTLPLEHQKTLDDANKILVKALDAIRHAHRVDLADLRAFAGPPDYERLAKDEDDEDMIEGGDQRPGYLWNRHVDLNRVARLLADHPDKTVRVAVLGADEQLSFGGGDWIAVLMPMIETDPPNPDHPRWPVR